MTGIGSVQSAVQHVPEMLQIEFGTPCRSCNERGTIKPMMENTTWIHMGRPQVWSFTINYFQNFVYSHVLTCTELTCVHIFNIYVYYIYIYWYIYIYVCVSTCIYHPLFRSILFRSHTPYWFLRGLALCRQVDVPSSNWSPEIPGAKHRKMLKEFDKRNVTRAA